MTLRSPCCVPLPPSAIFERCNLFGRQGNRLFLTSSMVISGESSVNSSHPHVFKQGAPETYFPTSSYHCLLTFCFDLRSLSNSHAD